jgi:hypothetical protein
VSNRPKKETMNPKLKDLPLLFFFLILSALTFAQEDSLRCEIRSLQHEITALKLEADAAGARSVEDFAPGTPTEHRDYQSVMGEIFRTQERLKSSVTLLDSTAQAAFERLLLSLAEFEEHQAYNNASVLKGQEENYELIFQQNYSLYGGISILGLDEPLIKEMAQNEETKEHGVLQMGCAEMDVKPLREWIMLLTYFTPYYRFVPIRAEVYGNYMVLTAGFDSIGETYNDYFEQTFYLKKVQP